ncbi:unnamed protein product [Somion occarium]|uniref:C2 NT-type domain-containing protein n=1 Tax=Somion occarium TaxID=3059160 RepID=A0ABP1DTB4_9APHY
MAKAIVPTPMPSRSSTSESLTSQSSVHHHSHYGFRTQLGQFLPRHALFQVNLNIEELSNVPLVKGEFAVRWKFKNVQSGSGLLSKMKNGGGGGARTASGGSVATTDDKSSVKGKGKAKADSSPYLLAAELHDDHSSESSKYSYESEHTAIDEESSIPSAKNSNESQSSSSSSYRHGISTSPLTTPVPVSATPTITKATATGMPTIPSLASSLYSHVEAKGMTEWAQLQSYNVKWNQKVSVVVQMDVHRETGDLLPNELKLVIMQRVIPGDPDAPRNPRLGAVYLNLAEYVDAGDVTRRYLLRESKTNATLKLTLNLTHVGGAKNYKPPPLRKGEIMAEVSGLLSNNDLLRTRLARTLDLYSRDELPTDDLHSELSSNRAQSEPQLRSTRLFPHRPYTNGDGAVDFDRLASLNGLHTTETLIEAIFNPVPTTSETPSPFTYYAPNEVEVDDPAESDSISKRSSSMRSDATTSTSDESGLFNSARSGTTGTGTSKPSSTYARSENSSLSTGTGEGKDHTSISGSLSLPDYHKPHWWQKMSSRSRPGTPTNGKRFFSASTPRLPLEVE